jgi:hypothetical protein
VLVKNSSRYTPLAAAFATTAALILARGLPEPPALDPDIAAVDEPAQPEEYYLRIVAKGQIARDVAAGKRSLVEAATLFAALNRLPPAATNLAVVVPYAADLSLPCATNEDRLCVQVALWVRGTFEPGQRGQAAAVLARLADEYRQAVRGTGTVRLPPPESLEPVEELLDRARREPSPPAPARVGAAGVLSRLDLAAQKTAHRHRRHQQ